MYVGNYLAHFGVKGMKWGVRREKDALNTTDRVIKKGTVIQNITSRQRTETGRHMYGAYTDYDKTFYTDSMGNFMYGQKGYRNNFVVKKDIRVPSDKKLVDEFTALAKANPKQVAKDMSAAYNTLHVFRQKSPKYFSKKISDLSPDKVALGEKMTKEYISLLVSDKTKLSRANFFGSLIRQGYEAMSDVNDRDQNSGSQDPLIVFRPNSSLRDGGSVKLTRKELDYYSELTTWDKAFKESKKDFSKVQR